MDTVDLCEIGKRIQNRRKQLMLTQEQLADLMDVSIQMVSNLERGNKAIRIDNLINLSRILNISTDYILMGKETADDMQTLTNQFVQLTERDRKMIGMMVQYCLMEQ